MFPYIFMEDKDSIQKLFEYDLISVQYNSVQKP